MLAEQTQLLAQPHVREVFTQSNMTVGQIELIDVDDLCDRTARKQALVLPGCLEGILELEESGGGAPLLVEVSTDRRSHHGGRRVECAPARCDRRNRLVEGLGHRGQQLERARWLGAEAGDFPQHPLGTQLAPFHASKALTGPPAWESHIPGGPGFPSVLG
ncbi:MAG TPA: hypothetical protein VLC09_05645, partial [Polyangiaceae bacterium]|nr:hypothetical protein [Polyangiaceae bacterium]